MPPKPDRILLVEGREDREFVYQFCNYHSINNRVLFDVEPKDGYESLRDDLMVRPLTVVKVIGAIVDADTDPHGRWHSLRSGLLASGYTDFPTEPVVSIPLPSPRYGSMQRRLPADSKLIWYVTNVATGNIGDSLDRPHP